MSRIELHSLFLRQLSDVCSLEQQLLANQTRFLNAATDRHLAKAIEQGMKGVQESRERVRSLMKEMAIHHIGSPNASFDVLIQEALVEAENYEDGGVKTIALIAMFQRLLNLELSMYGSLIDIARKLGAVESVSQLKKCIQETLLFESEIGRIILLSPSLTITRQTSPASEILLQPAV